MSLRATSRPELPGFLDEEGRPSPERIRTYKSDSPQGNWLIRPDFGQPRPSAYACDMDAYALLVALDGLLQAPE
jgi:hypothetical protein